MANVVCLTKIRASFRGIPTLTAPSSMPSRASAKNPMAEPATAVVLAIVVVGERPQWGAFMGLGLLLSGLAFVLWTESRGSQRQR